jgi:hypothetical protein
MWKSRYATWEFQYDDEKNNSWIPLSKEDCESMDLLAGSSSVSHRASLILLHWQTEFYEITAYDGSVYTMTRNADLGARNETLRVRPRLKKILIAEMDEDELFITVTKAFTGEAIGSWILLQQTWGNFLETLERDLHLVAADFLVLPRRVFCHGPNVISEWRDEPFLISPVRQVLQNDLHKRDAV